MFWVFVWLGVIIAAVVVELGTTALVSIWFMPSALVALILAAFGVPFWIQLIVFALLTLGFILGLRNIAKKFLFKKDEKTNMAALVGKDFLLLSAISDDVLGTVKINGVVWNCVSQNDVPVEKGARVCVCGVSGNKLIVKKQ